MNKEHDALHRRSLLLNTWGKLLETFICGSEPVYIIVDGLDECDEIERKQLMTAILRLLKNCSNLHVLIASRKEVDIHQKLESECKMLVVEERNRTDIERFVLAEINDLCRSMKKRKNTEPMTQAEEFFKTVQDNIVHQSEGNRSTEKTS